MVDVEFVESLARQAHHGQKDKAGADYFEHVKAVSLGLRPFGPAMEMAGLLHDVIEDTHWDAVRLLGAGVPGEVVDLVEKVTNDPLGIMTYREKITHIAQSPRAALVKIADNAHNSHPDRLAHLDEATRKRLTKKYAWARSVLWPAIEDPADINTVLLTVNRSLVGELHQYTWNRIKES